MQNNTQAPALTAAEKEQIVRSTRRTDLRNIIGGLFLVYGVLVTATGLLDPVADRALTGGIPINLWTGISMLVVGVLFFVWSKVAPVPAEDILASYENIEEKKAEGAGVSTPEL